MKQRTWLDGAGKVISRDNPEGKLISDIADKAYRYGWTQGFLTGTAEIMAGCALVFIYSAYMNSKRSKKKKEES